MSEQFEVRLQECLDALDEWGQDARLESILARYPEDAPALREALRLAGALAALDMQPDAAAQTASRREFVAAGLALKPARSRQPARVNYFLLRAGAFLAAALVVGAIPVAASGNALPGDALYPVKREVENVRLQIAPDDAARNTLAEQINAQRVQEVDDLVRDGRSAQTEFEGRVETLSANSMTVAGRVITLPVGAQGAGWVVGERLEVRVLVEGGRLVLVSAMPIPGGETPVSTSAASQTAAPMPSGTPAPAHEAGQGEAQSPEPHGSETPVPPGEGGTREPPSGGGDGGRVQPTEPGGSSVTAEPTSGEHSGGNGGSGGGEGGDDGGSTQGGGD